MIREEKTLLTSMNKVPEFKEALRKLTTNQILSDREKDFILSCAIIFLKKFKVDKRFVSLFELSYFIVLKYSVSYSDYRPLYDISINFGFYPISREIIELDLIDDLSLSNALMDISFDRFKKEKYLETYQQQKTRTEFMENQSPSLSFLAPTSFGKSSVIIDHIKMNNFDKVAIIVPTKSLLVQTYRAIKNSVTDKRIILHDEMYNGEDKFISIFTQERALRLLDRYDLFFDILYIDEAHNLFEKNSRSILLSRLIRKNLKRNPSQKTVYLSPLVNSSNNLLVQQQGEISEQKISHNIKEPELFEFRLNGEVFQYNRFVNEFYSLNFKGDMYSYILERQKYKNFIYIRSPKKIEAFSKLLVEELNILPENVDITEIIDELKRYVHNEFYVIEMLKRGVMYIHGKIPDIVKEFLEYKFKTITSLKFIVANTVILEGINLPIDNLFIMNTYSLRGKELTNLIGRVNRLDTVFNQGNNELNKLLPQIHFINSVEYNGSKFQMKKKIELLRNNFFKDDIKNPTLLNFDIDSIDLEDREKVEKIISNEHLVISDGHNEVTEFKKYLINSGIYSMYELNDENVLMDFMKQVKSIDKQIPGWEQLNIIDKIHKTFIFNLVKYIKDYEINRLDIEEARNFYKMYIFNKQRYSLNKNIQDTFRYFKTRKSKEGNYLYIGETYGEIEKPSENYRGKAKKVYIDLINKKDEELINLVIVKLKLEDDFISYKLNKFVIALFDFNLISEHEYHRIIYGTNDEKKIKLIKTGLSVNLITKLQEDDQIKNLYFDINNNLKMNKLFIAYKNSMNGFHRFELEKYL